MSLTREQILTEVLRLDPSEREALAEEILRSISPAERDAIDAAHVEESLRRYDELSKGENVGAPVDEVVARLRDSLRR